MFEQEELRIESQGDPSKIHGIKSCSSAEEYFEKQLSKGRKDFPPHHIRMVLDFFKQKKKGGQSVKKTEIATRSSLSVLIGLRNKFGRESNKDQGKKYTSLELYHMITTGIKKVNDPELVDYATNPYVHSQNYVFEDDEVWEHISDEIKRSKIKRFNWKAIFKGKTLTERILELKKKGIDVEKTYDYLSCCDEVDEFLIKYPMEQEELLKNLKTSVHARYGENDSANRIMSKEEGNDKG